MKRIFLASALIVCFACKRDTTDETATVAATTSSVASDITATVEFTGLVTHFLDTHQKAAIVHTTTHAHELRLPNDKNKKIEDIVKNKLGGSCPSFCQFSIDSMSLQLLDGAGKELSGDLVPDASFDVVTHLKKVDASAFDAGNLQPDATGTDSSTKVSFGYFDLKGGKAKAETLDCTGKLDTEQSFHGFPGKVTVTYTLTGGGFLRVKTTSATHDLPLNELGSAVLIEVDNELEDNKSHFHEYAKLSKNNPTMPKVLLDMDNAACKKAVDEQGGIPGCSNTQWP